MKIYVTKKEPATHHERACRLFLVSEIQIGTPLGESNPQLTLRSDPLEG